MVLFVEVIDSDSELISYLDVAGHSLGPASFPKGDNVFEGRLFQIDRKKLEYLEKVKALSGRETILVRRGRSFISAETYRFSAFTK